MKKLAIVAVFVTGMVATPAIAGTSATYTMSGSVTAICTATATGTLNFGTLTNSNGATSVQTLNPSFTDTSAFCNQAKTNVRVQRTDLVSANGTSNGFTNTLLITNAKVVSAQNAAGVTDTTSTGGGTSVGTTTLAASPFGAFTSLTISALAGAASGGNSLVAGSDYTGSVIVTLTPAS